MQISTELLSGFFGSFVTGILAFLVWYVRERGKISIYKQKALAEKEVQELNTSHGERFLFDKHIKEKLDDIRSQFLNNPDTIFLAKFHNGEKYIDRTHIMKWSVYLESCKKNENFCVKNTLQNRLTTDTAKFFGDLKEKGYSFCSDVENVKCDGWRVLMKSMKVNSYLAAIQESKTDVKGFVVVFFSESTQITDDDCQMLIQSLNSFSEYI